VIVATLGSRQGSQLKAADKRAGLANTGLDPGRQGPVGLAAHPPPGIEPAVHPEQQTVSPVTHQQHQWTAPHHLVKLVTMADHETTTIGGGMNGLLAQLDASEGLATEMMEKLVMVARYVNDPGIVAGDLKQLADHRLMGIRKMDPALHRDEIDNITHQVQRLALHMGQEIHQVSRLAVG